MIKTMQERVIEEEADLRERINSLAEFMATPKKWDGVPAEEQQRMENQSIVMKLLDKILCDRIRSFPPKAR